MPMVPDSLIRCDWLALNTLLEYLTDKVLNPVAHFLDADLINLLLSLIIASLLQDLFEGI